MPFQNSASSKVQRIGSVTLITAGEDQIQICVSTVTLSATVVGDPTGNTFSWVQISGSPVVIDDPTAITTFYTVAGTGDKTFRFYINQGTASEQFDDVTIFDTPISDQPSASLPSTQRLDLGFELPPVACDDILGTVEAISPPIIGDHADQPAATQLTLTFTNPVSDFNEFILQHQLFENGINVINFETSPLLPTATGVPGNGPPAGSPYTYTAGALTTYQVFTDYNQWGREETAASCVKDFSTLDVPPAIAVDDAIDGTAASFPTNRRLTQVRFSTEVVDVTPDDEVPTASLPTNKRVTVVRFSTEVVDVTPDDEVAAASLPTNRANAITRFDPSGIGGGGG